MPRTPPDPADKAFRHAVRLLRVRARSTIELRERLAAHPPHAVEQALRRLVEARLVDDAALTRDLTERDLAQGRSRRMTAARLRTRGLDPRDATPPVAGPARAGQSDAALALAAARQIARRLPASLAPEARWRRLLGAMARLGHEPDAAHDAARAVLGDPPCPETD